MNSQIAREVRAVLRALGGPNFDEPEPFADLLFGEAVRIAFRVEHGCNSNTEIADIMGCHKSRITQILRPERVGPKTITGIFRCITQPVMREMILAAWLASFRDDYFLQVVYVTSCGESPEELIRVVSNLIDSGAYRMAHIHLWHTEKRTKSVECQQAILDLQVSLGMASGRPHIAMRSAREMVNFGRSHPDPHRAAFGCLARAMILLTLPKWRPDLAIEALGQGLRDAPTTEPDSDSQFYQRAMASHLAAAQEGIQGLLMLENQSGLSEDESETMYEKNIRLATEASNPEDRASHLTEAAVALIGLRAPLSAFDLANQALRISKDQDEKIVPLLLMARSLAEDGRKASARALLANVYENYGYFRRANEKFVISDLALAENRLFPE